MEENKITGSKRVCKSCGKELPPDWVICPCEFGGPRNETLDENIFKLKQLLDASVHLTFGNRISHVYDPVVGACVHLLHRIRKLQNTLTGVSDQELELGTDNCCFLVYGKDLGRQDSEFISFLKGEGFLCKYSFWNCSWVWVNIETKVYGRGRPGVKYANIIGNHSITIDEFMTIYNIYKQYNGLPPLQYP